MQNNGEIYIGLKRTKLNGNLVLGENIYILSSFPSALDSKMPGTLNVNVSFSRVEAVGKDYKTSCCHLVLAISGAWFFFF